MLHYGYYYTLSLVFNVTLWLHYGYIMVTTVHSVWCLMLHYGYYYTLSLAFNVTLWLLLYTQFGV